jgi:hypothetical protein
MNRQIKLVLIVCIFLISTFVQAQQNGHITGTVFVLSEKFPDVRYLGCKLTFESDSVRKTVVTNESGEYQVDLPVGKYSLTANEKGFYPIERAAFVVKANSTSMINVMAVVMTFTISTFGDGHGGLFDVTETPKNPLQTENLRSIADRNAAMVRYSTRTIGADSTVYEGAILQSGDERLKVAPVLSVDVFTIYGDKIVVGKGSTKVRAIGNVVVEDGQQRRHGNEASLDLSSDHLKETLEITAVSP